MAERRRVLFSFDRDGNPTEFDYSAPDVIVDMDEQGTEEELLLLEEAG